MINSSDDSMTSGRVEPAEYRSSEQFTNHSDLPSDSYCRLCKAQRYGQWFVLKALKPEYVANSIYQGFLEKEFQLMMQLSHPNIVRVYGLEEDAVVGRAIVMEWVDGRLLEEFLRENPSQGSRRQVMRQLLDGLSYCHSRQIIHRDLKPGNILVTRNGGNVKIIDFGLSDSDGYAVLKEPAYTRAFAAPEQLAGEELDCRTDLYAAGLILKQLFPKRYGRIVRKCLRPRRESRYSSASELAAALASYDRHRKAASWIIVALLSVVILGIAVWWLMSKSPVTPTNSESSETTTEAVQPVSDTVSVPDLPLPTENISITKPAQDDKGELLTILTKNIRHEFDSIYTPLQKGIDNGTIQYKEQVDVKAAHSLCLCQIHAAQRKMLLPPELRATYQEIASEEWTRIYGYYISTDDKGRVNLPSFSDLHAQGKISDAEWEAINSKIIRDAEAANKDWQKLSRIYSGE